MATLPQIPTGPPPSPIPPAVGAGLGGPPEQPQEPVLNDVQARTSAMMNGIMQVDTMVQDIVRQFPELADGARKFMRVEDWLMTAVQSPNISGSPSPNPRIPG